MRNEDKTFLVNERPWGELNTLSNDRRGEKLSPQIVEEERAAKIEAQNAQRAAAADEANSRLAGLAAPVVDFFQPQPDPVVAPPPEVAAPVPQNVVQPQERDLSFLTGVLGGSSPADFANNMVIAARQKMGLGN